MNNRVTLATALLTATTLLTFVVAFDLGVQGAVIGFVINNVLILTGVLVAFTRRYRPALAFRPEFVREGWRYGMKAWVADLAIHANLRMDQWVLGMAALPEALGIYVPAVTISEMLWMLPDSLSFVLFNKIAALRSNLEQAELIERLHRVVLWTMALAGAAIALVAPWLVLLLYGQKYSASALPLALLMPGTVALCVCKVLTKYFGGTGQPQHSGTTAAVGSAAGFVLYLVLIPWFGAVGAVIGSSLCYFVTAIAAVLIYRSLVQRHTNRGCSGFAGRTWTGSSSRPTWPSAAGSPPQLHPFSRQPLERARTQRYPFLDGGLHGDFATHADSCFLFRQNRSQPCDESPGSAGCADRLVRMIFNSASCVWFDAVGARRGGDIVAATECLMIPNFLPDSTFQAVREGAEDMLERERAHVTQIHHGPNTLDVLSERVFPVAGKSRVLRRPAACGASLETVERHSGADGQGYKAIERLEQGPRSEVPDPETVLHSDIFFTTHKAWPVPHGRLGRDWRL